MTACLDRLEDAKLILRRIDATDRRARVVTLTAEGKRIIEKALVLRFDAAKAALSGMKKSEIEKLVAALKQIRTDKS